MLLAQFLYRRQLRREHGEFCFDSRDFLFALRILAGYFGLLQRFCGFRFIEVRATYCCIRQYSHLFGLHFQHTAGNEHEFLFCLSGHFDTNRAGLDARDQRCVARVDAELTRFAGQQTNSASPE